MVMLLDRVPRRRSDALLDGRRHLHLRGPPGSTRKALAMAVWSGLTTNDSRSGASRRLLLHERGRIEVAMKKTSGDFSRRQFFRVGATGLATSMVAGSGPVRTALAQSAPQGAPPVNTAPRVLRRPSIRELNRIARVYHLDLSQEDLTSFRNLMDGVLASYRRLDQFAEPTLPVKYPRNAGYRPPASENRLNAWYWKCSINGAPS